MVRDVTGGAAGEIKCVRYSEQGVTKRIPVTYVVEGGVTKLVFKEVRDDYEFLRYEHNEPGGAVEVISSDGSMVTITVPENNFGGGAFVFETDIPDSATGKDLTVSFSVKASYSGTLPSDSHASLYVTCRSWGTHKIGDCYEDVETDFSYTVYGNAVEDRVRLSINIVEFGDMTGSGTYTFVLKNVVINGKPCKFNF